MHLFIDDFNFIVHTCIFQLFSIDCRLQCIVRILIKTLIF